MFEYEKKYKELGYKLIAGMDEVGRGPLAGPVCCACVIMPENDIIEGVNDSKKLTAIKREQLAKLIKEKAIAYSIEFVDNEVIDNINISNATKVAMQNCVDNISIKPDIVLIDYVAKPTFNFKYETIVKGDTLSYSIACASIIAKVKRDALMDTYAKIYPEYNLEKNKGYGTKIHLEAIKKHGPIKIHRKTFIKGL